MNPSRFLTRRSAVALAAIALGCVMAMPALARDRVSVNVGVNVPGVSIGYSNYGQYRDYGHYRHGRGHYRHGYGYRGPVYYPAPVYYRPAPRVVYYETPVVVERPVYVRRGYESRVVYRDGYRDRGRYDNDD